MLHKIFGPQKRKPLFGTLVQAKSVHTCIPVEEQKSSALKIIHAGGKTEFYYMAIPAYRIMEKYPSFILAKPEVFWRPWDSVVRPEEILVPGHKYFIVPRHTVKKLRRRMRKPINDCFPNSFMSELSTDVSTQQESELARKSFKSKGNNRARDHRVRVSGTGIEKKPAGNEIVAVKKRQSRDEDGQKKSSPSNKSSERQRRIRSAITWEPSLTAIAECHGSEE